jgi:hypothetical protein
MINIQLKDTVIEVGQTLSGNCIWKGEKIPREVTLKVGWRTEGRGTVDSETIYTNAFSGTNSFSFSCKLPGLGPVSYDGEILRIIWEVTTESKFPQLFNKPEKNSCQFRVIPKTKTISFQCS